MSAASKAKGTRFERELVEWISDRGWDVQRLPRTGIKDEGDLEIRLPNDTRITIEAKNHKAFAWPDWIEQAEIEADHRQAKIGKVCHPVVVAKRRGKNAGDSYVMMELEEFLVFIKVLTGQLQGRVPGA